MSKVNVQIKRTSELAVIPTYKHDGDAGVDIRSIEDKIIYPGQVVKINTGICVSLPKGYAIEVSPRSGISSKTHIRVILGTVDSGYTGEIGVIAENVSQIEFVDQYNHDECSPDKEYINANLNEDGHYIEVRSIDDNDPEFHGPYHIKVGDRIAQLKLKEVPTCEWIEVDELSSTDRGNGGFGSTGVN